MNIINLGAFVLASTVVLSSVFFLSRGQPSLERTTNSSESLATWRSTANSRSSSEELPLFATQKDTDIAVIHTDPLTIDDGWASPSNRIPDGSSTTIPPDHHVETYLTSSELNVLHTRILGSFTGQNPAAVAQSIRVDTLGLDRLQQNQIFLEPTDHIILINDNLVEDLANNPAVGSILAGPFLKLAVQRDGEVFQVQLSSY